MEVTTFMELVKEIVRRNVIDWSNMRLSLEESSVMFLFICGQSSRTRNAGDRFQHSNETIHRHFDYVKAIDGTHIAAVAQEAYQMPYQRRKKNQLKKMKMKTKNEGECGGEGEGEGGVENANRNEDGVPAM
ncbi:hypothetical protein ACSBR2_019892 [Camellia fascicularis]